MAQYDAILTVHGYYYTFFKIKIIFFKYYFINQNKLSMFCVRDDSGPCREASSLASVAYLHVYS